MIVGVVSLDLAQIKEGWKQTSDAVAEGWAEVPKKIKDSFDEGERMVNEFMKGQVSASAGATEQQKKQQEALTATQKKELAKREKQARETRQRMWESERELQERIREERSAVAMSAQELEEERLNRMFERGELSYNAYVAELDSRIAYAKIMYGREAEIVKEMEAKKRALQQGTVKSFIGSLASLMGQYKGKNKDMFNIAKGAAIAQATINTYEGASKALSAYPPPFSFIAAAAQIAAGIAQVINIKNVGFFRGGFTGPGSDTDTAGVVHRNEYVAPASQVRRNPGLFSLLNLERQGRAALATAGAAASAGEDNSARVAFMLSKEIGRQLQQMSWRVQLDSEGLAISMEQGNDSLNDLEY
ncbi:MAG TPA: hypothetical protein ENK32_01410 [Anaerolineae bacterium]|nr:hypothetical protein [Anaerolineae bacterium]